MPVSCSAYLDNPRRPVRYYQELVRLSDEFLAQDPRSFQGFRIKANLAASDGRLDDALDFFNKADGIEPMEPNVVPAWLRTLLLAGRTAEAESLAERFIQKHKDFPQIYDILYQYYSSHHRASDAERILQIKVLNNPGIADFAVQLASYYAVAGKHDQMVATLQALDNPKVFPDGHLEVGDFHRARQDWPESLSEYQHGARDNKILNPCGKLWPGR